jgi:uncharacterized damage-inducible protein DinB
MSFPADQKPMDLLYPDLDQELATTRKMIAAVPDGQNDWKPHEKSMTLGALASHLAQLPGFGLQILTTEEFDFAATKFPNPKHERNAERLEMFDTLSAQLKQQIASSDWDALAKKWTLRAGDKIFFAEPKAKLVRTMYLSHSSHHRAQLGVYLRQLGVPIPGAYGPSADEMGG